MVQRRCRVQRWCRGAVAKVQMQLRSRAACRCRGSAGCRFRGGAEVVERWRSGGAAVVLRCRGAEVQRSCADGVVQI
jgi:hypothetical protein